MLNKNKINKKAMSIIEVMIAIFIFTLWIASVFMIISSTSNINSYNKNFIIASNLAREQIELIRNIRDTNYKKFQKWNMLRPWWTNYNTVFKEWNFYKFENCFEWSCQFHIKSSTWSIVSDIEETIKNNNFKKYRLCLENNKYVYCEDNSSTNFTPFYKYIEIKKLKDWAWNIIKNSFKINSKVYWNIKWIHKVEIPTILADYKRL